MYAEHFKKRLFSSTWRISVAQGMIHMKLLVACLNVILHIGYYHRVDTFVLVVFAVGSLLQLALVTTSPRLPYVCLSVCLYIYICLSFSSFWYKMKVHVSINWDNLRVCTMP